MKGLKFDSQGKLLGIPGMVSEKASDNKYTEDPELREEMQGDLKTSESLEFLKESKMESIIDESGWSLHSNIDNGEKLDPLKFSNGKTQENVVDEVIDLIKSGKKVVFIHGACGTGKSAIALNIARRLGKASIVVPVKGLQTQYERDYTKEKYVVMPSGKRMRIAMITGRANHDSLIKPGISCADSLLPDTIKFAEKNIALLKDFYYDNPLINSKVDPTLRQLRRISVAPANPYWSPIVNADYELPLHDAEKKKYQGLLGKEFIFYHRKRGCSYYDQYQAYIDSDVIIFNSAKYLIEMTMDRKPMTAVDIIDEADEFLDNLSEQESLNLSRLKSSLLSLRPENEKAKETIDGILDFIQLEEKRIQAVGINEDAIFECKNTKILKIIELLLSSPELEAELSLDEMNYGSQALDIAKKFSGFLDVTYITYAKKDFDIIVNLVTTELSRKFDELSSKNHALVLMSGTLHSPEVLKSIFGIKDFSVVEAETLQQGSVEILQTGKEFDCKRASFTSGNKSREDYLSALSACLGKTKKPVLIHVQAYEDLPANHEIGLYSLSDLISRETLFEMQMKDGAGKAISAFKEKKSKALFSTRCSRGVDFPGDTCHSIVYTKYPNPNVQNIFWKVLKKTHEKEYWGFYFDRAKREFLQRLYRALRSPEDFVSVSSPDTRVLNAIREVQRKTM